MFTDYFFHDVLRERVFSAQAQCACTVAEAIPDFVPEAWMQRGHTLFWFESDGYFHAHSASRFHQIGKFWLVTFAPNKSLERNARWTLRFIRFEFWFHKVAGRAWLSFLR